MASTLKNVEKTYEVVVVGGGLAGVCAAIAAARHGARTALVQARPMFGGNASSEVRMHVVGAGCHMAKPDASETGILMELLLENKRRNPYHVFPVFDSVLWEKVRFQDGLDSYLNTVVRDVETKGDRITHVVGYQDTTETAYRFGAEVFIDATGHGTIGIRAGAESRMGSEARGEFDESTAPLAADTYTMGNTLMFQAVDRGEPVKFEKPFWAHRFSEDDLQHRPHVESASSFGDGGVAEGFHEGKMRNLPQFSTMDAGYWWIELGGDSGNIIAEAERIRDELLKSVYGVWDHLKNQGDHGAANYDLEWVGMVPGTRESRRLVGDHLLNENDIRANRVFPDAVAYGGWAMDEHVPRGLFDFHNTPAKIYNFDGLYTIPYRCFYSRNVGNLMMAGRDISTTKKALGSTRVMGTCAVGGQAAGTAAAMAVKYHCTPREIGVRIGELQQALLKDDCYIPGFANTDPEDLARRASVSATSSVPGGEAQQVTNGVTRIVGGTQNCWESQPLRQDGETLTLTWKVPVTVSEIRLVFDPNLTREIMPTIIALVRDRQSKTLPEELVKDYTVALYRGTTQVHARTVTGNSQRLNVLALPQKIEADRLCLTVLATHGYRAARVFEVRVY